MVGQPESKQLPAVQAAKTPAASVVAIAPGNTGGSLQPQTFDDVVHIAKIYAEAGCLAEGRDAAKLCLKMMAGLEMGLSPTVAATGLYVGPGGAIGAKAELIKDRIARHPDYSYKVLELSDDKVVVEFLVRGDSAGPPVEWTWERAKEAGLATGKNSHTWHKWRRNMLFKQCIQDGSRFYFPGLWNGMPIFDEDVMEAIDAEPVSRVNQVKRRAQDKAVAAQERQEAAEEISDAQVVEPASETTEAAEPLPEPTLEQVLEAAKEIAEEHGDAGAAQAHEAALNRVKEEKQKKPDIGKLVLFSTKRGWKIAQLRFHIYECYGIHPDDLAKALTAEQEKEVYEHVAHNAPPAVPALFPPAKEEAPAQP